VRRRDVGRAVVAVPVAPLRDVAVSHGGPTHDAGSDLAVGRTLRAGARTPFRGVADAGRRPTRLARRTEPAIGGTARGRAAVPASQVAGFVAVRQPVAAPHGL